MYTHLENYAAPGAGPQRVTKPSRMRAESDGLPRDCGSSPCTPAAGSPAILTSGGLGASPRARGVAGAAPAPQGSPALPFVFWEAGDDWLQALSHAPPPRPLRPRRVGRAGAETLGLGSVRNALKRRRAALRQRWPAERARERAPRTEERAGEAQARLGPKRALCSAKCQLHADWLGAHLPAGRSEGI